MFKIINIIIDNTSKEVVKQHFNSGLDNLQTDVRMVLQKLCTSLGTMLESTQVVKFNKLSNVNDTFLCSPKKFASSIFSAQNDEVMQDVRNYFILQSDGQLNNISFKREIVESISKNKNIQLFYLILKTYVDIVIKAQQGDK